MKILYISTSPRISTKGSCRLAGPRSHIEGVINALKRLGHQVSSVVVGNAFPQSRSGKDRGTRLPTMWKRLALDIFRISLQWAVDCYLFIRILVSRPDIIYERYVPMRGRPLFRSTFKGRYIVEYNGVPSLEQTVQVPTIALQKLAQRRERASIDAADTAIFVSEEMRSVFMTHIGAAHPDRAVVVPNAVDVAKFQLPESRSIQPFRFIFVGHLVAYQRLDLLLEALVRLGPQSTVEAAIIGDGEQLEALRQLRDKLGLAHRVRIPGFLSHPQVVDEMLRANCGYSVQGDMAFGGKNYTSPLKLYEYLAAGLPFISQWSVDGANIANALGTQNLLCDLTVDSVHLAIDAALQVFSDEEVCAAFAEKAHALARSEHSWERRMRTLIGPAKHH